MSIETITILMFASMAILLFAGLPIAFALGAVAMIFTVFLWGVPKLHLIILDIYDLWGTIILIAIPLFILMGCILERSGIADDLYGLMYGVIGRLKGGIAIATVAACTIMAAMVGTSSASVVTMGIVALPSMLKRNYDKSIATGSIMGGGALGILIPPSTSMILFGVFASESVGRLFAGGLFPGLLLSVLFCLYIGIRCHLQPKLGPAVDPKEAFTLKQTMVALKGLILPIFLILAVLGTIFTGIATPTEAAAVGAAGAIIAALIRGNLKYHLFKEALYRTFSVSSMIFWVIIGAGLFVGVYTALGAPKLVEQIIMSLGLNRWVVAILMQVVILIMGCFIDLIGIILITTPLFVPIMRALGFDIVWYGVIFTMNLEMALLTPPFGLNMFFLKGVTPKDITMGDLYRAVTPFVVLQMLGLATVMVFPQIALFLPGALFKVR